jgi:hypothetical protein
MPPPDEYDPFASHREIFDMLVERLAQAAGIISLVCEHINAARMNRSWLLSMEEPSIDIPMNGPNLLHLRANLDLIDLCTEQAQQLYDSTRICLDDSTLALERLLDDNSTAVANYFVSEMNLVGPLSFFYRRLLYRAADQELWELPLIPEQVWSDQIGQEVSRYRAQIILSRVLWLEQRKHDGQELYPATGTYTVNHHIDVASAEQNLRDHRHLSHEGYKDDRGAEWAVLAFLTAYFTVAQTGFDRYTETIVQRLREGNHTAKPDIASFTTEATAEAMASDETYCYACRFDFDPEFSDEEFKEPAVKSTCGHLHGVVCLTEWVNDGNCSCPKCRRDLFSQELLLPPRALAHYRKVCYYIEKAQTFDPEIDSILSKDFTLCHDKDFGKFLHRLIETATSFSRAYQELEREVWKIVDGINTVDLSDQDQVFVEELDEE